MKKVLSLLLAFMLLAGCTQQPPADDPQPQPTQKDDLQITTEAPQVDVQSLFSDRDYRTDYEKFATVTLNGSTAASDSNAVRIEGSTITITDEGTYVLTGKLDGMVIVDADKEDKTQLVLQNAQITNSAGAPLYIRQADKVFVTLAEKTENTLIAGESFAQLDDNNIDGTVFSKADLTFNGLGKLAVSSPAGHGIVCKDSLRFTGGSYTVTSAAHAIAAKDELCIHGGSFVVAAGKDGIHCENNEDAALGYLYIKDGAFDITAEGDGISAAAWLRTDGGSYQIVAGGGSKNGSKQSSDNWGGFGGGKRPGKPGTAQVQPMAHTPETTDSTSIKGLKAGTWLTVNAGSFQLDTADDALHCNGGMDITGGSLQLSSGDDGIHAEQTLTVIGGNITISESYEGLEALHIKIYSGNIKLKASDDGINAAGGTDESGFGGRDQWSGGKGGFGGKGGRGGFGSGNGSILIAGGELDITASGDAIDSNGTLEITGGQTLLSGPTRGDTAVLDYDRSGTISGGVFLGTGGAGMAQTLTGTSQGVIALRVNNQPANTQITVTDSTGNVICSHAPALECALILFSSPDVQKGETYTVTMGTQTQTVTAK